MTGKEPFFINIELTDWIEHQPGPCPVPGDTCPAVMFSDGRTIPMHQLRADCWVESRWTGVRGPYQKGKLPPRIIAYIPESKDTTNADHP